MMRYNSFLSVLMLSFMMLVGTAMASEPASNNSQIGGALIKPGDYLGQIMISLLLVLAIIFIGAWLVKRYGRFSAVADGQLRVLGMLSVGQKERIMLLQVGSQQLLVGVTPSRITRLHELAEPIVIEEQDQTTIKPSFSQRLQDALKQRYTGENS